MVSNLFSVCYFNDYTFLPLPPYSPEYNPIEKTWAQSKSASKSITKLQYILRDYFILFLFQLTMLFALVTQSLILILLPPPEIVNDFYVKFSLHFLYIVPIFLRD